MKTFNIAGKFADTTTPDGIILQAPTFVDFLLEALPKLNPYAPHDDRNGLPMPVFKIGEQRRIFKICDALEDAKSNGLNDIVLDDHSHEYLMAFMNAYTPREASREFILLFDKIAAAEEYKPPQPKPE